MPKTIAESYGQIYRIARLKKDELPKAEIDPEGFVRISADVRKADFKLRAYHAGLMRCRLSIDQVTSAFVPLYGQDKVTEWINGIEKTVGFGGILQRYILNDPDIHKYLTKEEKEKLKKNSSLSIGLLKRLITEGKVDQDLYNRGVAEELVVLGVMNNGGPESVRALENVMNDEQKKYVQDTVNNAIDKSDLPVEEQVTHPHHDLIESLKAKELPENVNHQEYIEALEYADNHLTLVDPVVSEEVQTYEHDVQTVEARHTKKIYKDSVSEFQGGRFNKLFNEVKYGKKHIVVTAPDKLEAYNEVYNGNIGFSDKTKEGIKLMLRKMDELNLFDHAFDLSGEDPHRPGRSGSLPCHLLRRRPVRERFGQDSQVFHQRGRSASQGLGETDLRGKGGSQAPGRPHGLCQRSPVYPDLLPIMRPRKTANFPVKTELGLHFAVLVL